MKEYSKYNKTDLIVIIALILLLSIIVIIIFNRNRHVSKYHEKDFLKNLDVYNTMAEIYYEDYQKHNNRIISYSAIEDDTIYCFDYSYEIVLDKYKSKICRRGIEAFMRGTMIYNVEDVYVYDTFVSFCDSDGLGSIIYSVKDKRPSYLKYPDDGKRHIKIEKITDHWYYAYVKYRYERYEKEY